MQSDEEKMVENVIVKGSSPFNLPIVPIFLFISNLFTLMYLGWDFNVPNQIDTSNWKRKWMNVSAWLQFVFAILWLFALLPLLFIFPIQMIPLFITLILMIITSIFTLIYIGWTVNETSDIDLSDWKRKWIIFFAYLGLIGSFFTFIQSIYRIQQVARFIRNEFKPTYDIYN